MKIIKNFSRYGVKYWILSYLFINFPKGLNRLRVNNPIRFQLTRLINNYNELIMKIANLIPNPIYSKEEQEKREQIALEVVNNILGVNKKVN